MPRWSERPFVEELPRLLAERKMSLRALAREIGVSQAYLWNVVHQRHSKRANADLLRRIALTLGKPEDYFPEYREAVVLERVRSDGKLRDQLYKRITAAREK